MATVVVDYGAGNLRSAVKALAAAGGGRVLVSRDPEAIAAAERIVLPGVGAFADCRRGLDAVDGLVAALEEAVRKRGAPFLGICVGMQLMASLGVEYGEHPGLGWIPGRVVRLAPADPALKIPQVGWNDLALLRFHPLFAGLEGGGHGYFVHSYHFLPERAEDWLAGVEYGGRIAAAVASGNMAGVQFHPEKSQRFGLALLANFLNWRP